MKFVKEKKKKKRKNINLQENTHKYAHHTVSGKMCSHARRPSALLFLGGGSMPAVITSFVDPHFQVMFPLQPASTFLRA